MSRENNEVSSFVEHWFECYLSPFNSFTSNCREKSEKFPVIRNLNKFLRAYNKMMQNKVTNKCYVYSPMTGYTCWIGDLSLNNTKDKRGLLLEFYGLLKLVVETSQTRRDIQNATKHTNTRLCVNICLSWAQSMLNVGVRKAQ